MHNPDAFFDTLAIVSELGPALGSVGRLETQRAAYLACLLAVYDGRPIAEWGYRFARTEFGTPFSAGINDALDTLTSAGHLSEFENRFSLTDSGKTLRDALFKMGSQSERRRFLSAACGSALVVPPATFSESLENEPTMRRALQRESGGGLLDGPALQLLYEQFAMLTEVVGTEGGGDLLTSSVVWLSYMAKEPLSHQEEIGSDA